MSLTGYFCVKQSDHITCTMPSEMVGGGLLTRSENGDLWPVCHLANDACGKGEKRDFEVLMSLTVTQSNVFRMRLVKGQVGNSQTSERLDGYAVGILG